MDDEAPVKYSGQCSSNKEATSRRHLEQAHPVNMSKLAPGLKALINAPFSRPDATAAPARIREVYKAIANDAAKKNVGLKPWLALTVRLERLSPSAAFSRAYLAVTDLGID